MNIEERKGLHRMVYIIIVGWFLFDQISKYWIQNHFFLGESVSIIPNVFHLTYILNEGAAFGILANQRYFFLGIAGLLVILSLWFNAYISARPNSFKVGMGLLIGGTLGNAYDRFQLGAVVDFFDFRVWPIFNIADIGICIGVALIIWEIWQEDEFHTKNVKGKE